MRGMGRLFQPRWKRKDGTWYKGTVWWIAYNHRGKEYRESSHSVNEAHARKLLKKRIAEIGAGNFIVSEDRLTFDEMVSALLDDYRVNERRSIETVRYYLVHLKAFFGFDRAIDITADRVKSYQVHRLNEKAANASINREVATLGRMLSLAVQCGKLSRRIKFQMLEENNVRQGFLDHGDFLALLANLPDYLRPLAEFLYLSGWRKGEGQKLEWRDVDLRGQVIRLRIENSKNKEARVLPLTGRLQEIIHDLARNRRLDCPYVFNNAGKKIGEFKRAWRTACKKSGLDGTLVHDLRRCATRNLSRAGVPEAVAMEITGHKTRSMYRRYRIVDERDLRDATEKLQAHLERQAKAPSVVAITISHAASR